MVTVQEIYEYLDSIAPVRYQMDFDNAGFLVGDRRAPVSRVLTALDITDDVISEAINIGAELIVAHHPLLFHPLRQVLADDPAGRKVISLAENGVSAICMHTNLDIADGGVNDALMDVLGAKTTGLLEPAGTDEDGTPLGCGRIGFLPEAIPLSEFLPFLTQRLKVSGLRFCSGGRDVYRIAVCGGAGGSMLELAFEAGCDTFVTADIKYDRFLTAKELGVNLIDADHFCTENVVIPVLTQKLKKRFPELDVQMSSVLTQTAEFYMP